MNEHIAAERLRNQRLTTSGLVRPADVVGWLGAVQAQEYDAAKWALALRMKDSTVDAEIERAFEQGRILRTHVMRPTWHFVTPRDIRWLLELTAPHVQRAMASYNRRLELDARTLTRAVGIIERALRDRRYLTRIELGDRLQRLALAMAGQRLAHLAMHAELEGVICSGPRRGKRFTYALLDERAPGRRRLDRDEALAELSRRYFTSHGPATVRDFVWWSGLRTADAMRGLKLCKARREEIEGRTYWRIESSTRSSTRDALLHLLPIYDEYLVAYRDRGPVPHGPPLLTPRSGGSVTFQHAIVIHGQVAGTWRTTRTPRGMSVQATPLRRLSRLEHDALTTEIGRYERFLGFPVAAALG